MEIDCKTREDKLQHDINREAAKISVFLSGKTDKYQSLTGEEILPSDQGRVIEQAYIVSLQVYIFSFRKSFRKTK